MGAVPLLDFGGKIVMRIILRHFLCVVAMITASFPSLVWAQTPSPCPACNPASVHPLAYCVIPAQWGQPEVDFGPGVTYGGAAGVACSRLAAFVAVSNPPGSSLSRCGANLPIAWASSGGSWVGLNVVDDLTILNWPVPPDNIQTVYYQGINEVRSFGSCGCSDSFNINAVGVGTDGQCYCKNGLSWDGSADRCVATPPAPIRIDLYGASSTKALVAGPALPQSARVTQNGAPATGKFVNISIASGGSLSGITDGSGEFRFTYVPPHHKTVDQLTGTCSGCSNTVQKAIIVEACDVCGDKKGDPISTATGEKEQAEVDWQDSGVHPLSFTRHYRSFANIETGGLGPRWSHNYAAFASKADLEATVRFGDGRKVLFKRDNVVSAWVADNLKDSLIESAAGLTYVRASDESRWQFDPAGKLLSITQRNGWTASLAYNAANQLVSVTNAFGRALQFGYDASGRLVAVIAPDGSQITYAYDGAGRLAGATYPNATSRSYFYEDARWATALTGITNEAGVRYSSTSYDDAGRAVNTQNAGARNYSVSYPGGSAAATGSLIAGTTVDSGIYRTTAQITDPLGTSQSYTWQGGDGQVRLLNASGAFEGGQVASRSFGALNLADSESDFLGVQTTYTWDLNRRLKLSTTKAVGRPEAQTSSIQWHPSFRLPVLVTEAGRSTAYSYDSLGNKLSETVTDTATSQARTTAWSYNNQGLPDSTTDPKGAVWTYGYDSAGNRTSVRNPLGQQTSYSYDAGGRMTGQNDPNGMVTSYAYDVRGRLTGQNRGGEVTAYSYTPTGQLASATLPDGYQVIYGYDAADRLIAATDNRGATIQYTLDGMGNRIGEQLKDANGSIALATGRVINSLNKVAAIQGAQGQTTALAYDANGEPVSTTDPLQQTTRQTLDGLRRPVATTFADNTSAGQAWNQLDQLIRVIDPKGVQTAYATNAFGEVIQEASPDIGAMSYQRNAAGEVIAVTDAKGDTGTITRDALGRPLQVSYADQAQEFLSYDTAGNVTHIDDRSGSTSYTRDLQGRVLAKTQTVNDNPSTPSRYAVQYGYSAGDLATVKYPSGLQVLLRRSAGRVTQIDVQEPPNASGKATAVKPFASDLAYTALGQPRSWRWNSGDSASRSFDADGRMTGNEVASYSWDAASRITAITQSLWASKTVTQVIGTATVTTTQLYQAPVTWSATYDHRNRLTGMARSGASSSFSYDANSNRLTAADTAGSDVDLEGQFDADNLTQSATQAQNLDAASNKLLGFSQTITTLQGGAAVSSVTSQVNYALDANGAMTSDGLRTFVYDAGQRLSKVEAIRSGEAASVAYLTNALGQRVFKGEPQTEQLTPNEKNLGQGFIGWLRQNFGWLFSPGKGGNASLGMAYVYDEDGNLLGEYDNGTAIGKGRTEYIWLPAEDGTSMPIGIYRNGKFYAVHPDHLGTARLITDSTNTPVWQWPYSAFGNNKPTGILSTITSGTQTRLKATKPQQEVNLRFPGQYFDSESNLSYNYFRSYNGSQGRYTQPDPVGLGGGLTRFSYVGANPLRYADPSGLDPWWKEPDPWYPGTSAPPFQCRPDGNPWGWGCGDEKTDHRVPDVVGGVNMIPACRKHDDCYDGASKPGASKPQCDNQLKKDIYELCRQAGHSNYYCKSLSYSYFKGVDVGGTDAWNRAKAKKP
jgi:RHS repeat-associated protein